MKKQLITGLLALALTGCVATPPVEKPMTISADAALAEAADLLAMAKKQGAEWKVIDKATGGKAARLSETLKVANEKAAAGETDEAIRLARKVSTFATLGVEQAKSQMDAIPYY